MQEEGHPHPHDQREDRHEEGQRAAFRRGRRRRQGELGGRPRREQARRAVEVGADAVLRGVQGGVGRRVEGQGEQRVTDGDLLARLPSRGRGERLAVHGRRHPFVGGDLAAGPVVNVDVQRLPGNGLVADPHGRVGAAADVRVARTEPVDHADGGSACHPDVDKAGRLGDHASVSVAEADHGTVQDRSLGQRKPRRYLLVVDVQRGSELVFPEGRGGGVGERAARRGGRTGSGGKSSTRAPPSSPGGAPPRANRSSSAATARIGVAGSASSTMSADCRVAGETTVSASRMLPSPFHPGNPSGVQPRAT